MGMFLDFHVLLLFWVEMILQTELKVQDEHIFEVWSSHALLDCNLSISQAGAIPVRFYYPNRRAVLLLLVNRAGKGGHLVSVT